MSNAKQTTRKMKGGMLAAIIATFVALLTVGVGVAFGAEGAADIVKQTVGDLVGGVANAANGGGALLRGGLTKGGDDEKGGDGKEYDGFTVYKIWDDGHNQRGLRGDEDPVHVVLYRTKSDDPWGEPERVDEMDLDSSNEVEQTIDQHGGENYLNIDGIEKAQDEEGNEYLRETRALDAWVGRFEGTYPMYDEGSGSEYTYYVQEDYVLNNYSASYYANKDEGIFYVVNTALHVNVAKVEEIIDGELPEYLDGAELAMEGGGQIWEWTSGNKPETLWGLSTGVQYEIRETMVPVGYMPSASNWNLRFSIREDGTLDLEWWSGRVIHDEVEYGGEEDILLVENTAFSVDIDLGVGKRIDGRSWTSSDSFLFRIEAVGDAPAPTGSDTITLNSRRKVGWFDPITIREAGTYRYTIKEDIPNGATPVGNGLYRSGNLLYDCSEHSAVVTVYDDGLAYVSYDNGPQSWIGDDPTPPTITNTYSPVGAAEIHGTKTLAGRALQDGEFTFGLYENGTSLVATATNDENGDFTIVANYEGLGSVGPHSYTVREIVPDTPETGMAYDDAEFPVSVDVSEVNYALECAVSGSASFANTYTPTGSLSVSKTVAGEGADTSQQFAFTVTLNPQLSGDYGDMSFAGGVASFSLSDGQTITATNIPAGTTYAVTETPAENYTPSCSGESGAIVADQTATAAFTNTYTAPQAPIVPETSAIVVNRIDDAAGLESASMLLAESVPSEMPVSNIDLSTLQMVITPGDVVVAPTADPITNSLVYSFQMSNGQTANVNLVVGSSVSIINSTSSVNLTKKDGDGTSDGQTFTVGTAPANDTLSLTVGASSTNQQNPAGGRAKGWIQVNKVINDGATYDAFKVFDADVVQDGEDYKATHLTWASDAMKAAVISYVSTIDSDSDGHTDYEEWIADKYGKDVTRVDVQDKENPQNMAEWIAIKIADSDEDATAGTTPKTTKGDTFATQLAAILRNYGLEPTVVIPANTRTEADQGYYIVATTTPTIENGEAGTAPIWAPVPQTGYVVDEKVSVPTFNKQVRDNTDDTTNFNKVADASTGQWLDFKLTTTLPQNLRAYPAYSISIADQIPDGMDATIDTENGFSISLAGTDITGKADAALAGNVLTVSVANLLDSETLGVAADGGDTLIVNYRAKLNENSVKGNAGNNNTATLTYSADPLVPSTKGTLESSARVLTYQIQVDKVDEATRLNVDGAEFVAQTEVDGTTYWVKADGSLTEDEAERGVWTTENGSITISGVDEGTYTLTEIAAPNLYETLALPLVVEVDAVKDYAGGSLTSLGARVSGANGTLVDNPDANQDGFVGSVLQTGVLHVRVSDVRQVVLPLTGMPVKTAGIIAGILIAGASIVAFAMSKRNKDDEEE